MKKATFRDLFAAAEKDPAYWSERAILRVAEEIALAMERAGISRSELARRLGASPAYVTKILRGNANFTLDSLARIAYSLGGEFRFHLAPKGVETRWIDVVRHTWASEIDWGRPLAPVPAAAPEAWRPPVELVGPGADIEAFEVREVAHAESAAAA